MQNGTLIHAENSPEAIAYKLFLHILEAKDFRSGGSGDNQPKPERRWILDTYAECLLAVKRPSDRRKAAEEWADQARLGLKSDR